MTTPPQSAVVNREAKREARRYPERPIVGVLAVVLRGDKALVVRRANPPMAGRWGFPGGVLKLGETVAAGAMRELFEETGVVAEPIGPLTVIDTIDRDDAGAGARVKGRPATMPTKSPGSAPPTSSTGRCRPRRCWCR